VIRFWNGDVLNNLDAVIGQIDTEVQARLARTETKALPR
jgi:very-short-patch-repair endonuclease